MHDLTSRLQLDLLQLRICFRNCRKRRKIVKRLEAPEALALLITAYEKAAVAIISEEITEPGYYWIDGKIVGYGINQRLDLNPQNNQDDRNAILECIEVLEGLQSRSKKKVAFPTVLKWGILSPFSFITKTQSKGVDDWLPWLYLYDATDTGKTTLIINAVLAVWDKHDKERDETHFKRTRKPRFSIQIRNYRKSNNLSCFGRRGSWPSKRQ